MVKNKGLIAEAYELDEEEVSSDDNEVTEVKALMALADEERVSVGKESAINGEWIKISMKKIHTLLEMEDTDDRKYFLDYTKDNDINIEFEVKIHIQALKTLKESIINEPSSAPARGNKSSSASKTNSAPASKLKNVKMIDDPPLAIVMKELNELKLQISKNKSSYSETRILNMTCLLQRARYEIGSTSNAHATVSAPMIITSVDEPVSQVEELSRNVHYLLRESGIKGKEAKVLKTEMKKLAKHMDSWDKDFKNEWLYTCKLEKKLCEVEDKVEKKEEEKVEMKKYITELERMKECMEEMKGKWELMDYKYEMMAKDKERLEMTLANVHVMMADRLGWYDMDERSNDAIDVLKTYGTTPPPGLQDPSNDP
ncbi:hypothetical protein Tco_0260231 [Tanacetum coccineum]